MFCNFTSTCTQTECSGDNFRLNDLEENDKNIILTESSLYSKNFFHLSQLNLCICSTHFCELLKRNNDLRRRKGCLLPTCISLHPPAVQCDTSLFGLHKKSKARQSRNIFIADVQKIQQCYGVVIPVGTPACVTCLKRINQEFQDVSEIEEEKASVKDENQWSRNEEEFSNNNITSGSYGQETTVDMQMDTNDHKKIEESASESTAGNFDSQPDFSQSQSQISQGSHIYLSQINALNEFLQAVGLPEFSEEERKKWNSYSSRSQKTYKERFFNIIKLIIGILFPSDSDEVLCSLELKETCLEKKTPSLTEFSDVVDSYKKVETWQQGRQVLSVLASRMSYKDVISLIPDVTPHLYYAALSHSKTIGPAMPVPEKKNSRQKMDPEKLESFLDFITSSNVVRDLPFGEKKLKMSDGTVHNMPNVVRCMGSADIIHQFKTYCQENDIVPLGDSTMFKILAQCGAKVRKSLEGLDYFVAEGGRAFLVLQDVIEKLLKFEAITLGTFKDFQALLLQSKQYFRTDYKIHISQASEVPDHCMMYALSDRKDVAFSVDCDHTHQMVCESCEQFREIVSALEKIFATTSVDGKENEMNDLHFKTQKATKSIQSLKNHIVRCKNQDLAKIHLFETMPPDEVLLVCDWAMKFLPRKFREDQCDWFGKRGIPWHICIAFCRKEDGSIGSVGFVHLFSSQISQDSHVTVSIIKDVMAKVQEITDGNIKFHIWSDNAGCYKSTETMSHLFHCKMVKTYNFCESQNGKGPCDRTAATLKSAIRRYVNQGHDVLTAHSMKEAIEKSTKNVRYLVTVHEGVEGQKTQYKAIPAISSYSNFVFTSDGINVKKAYQVGAGKLIPSSNIPEVEPCVLKSTTVDVDGEDGIGFHSLPKKSNVTRNESVFTCANEGCFLTFTSSHELSSHLMFGKCEFVFHCQSSNGCDVAKRMYAEKMSKSFATNFTVSASGQSVRNVDNDEMEKGWALKVNNPKKRFNDNQIKYLTTKFREGLRTGRKEDPFALSEAMLNERLPDGSRRFTYEEVLSVQQITSFFSRMCRNKKLSEVDDDDDNVVIDASREETISEIRRDLVI